MQTFNEALDHVGPANWAALEGDIEVMLLRSTGNAPDLTEGTIAAVLSGGAVEVTDTGYAREATQNHTVTVDGKDRSLDCDSVIFPSLGTVGTGQTVLGALFFLNVTDDSDSVPLLWAPEFTGTLNGTDVILQIGTDGLWLFDADPV